MNEPGTPPAHRPVRVIALAVAAVCLLAVAAGAFALSYPGARATVVNAGVSTDLARVYPGIFGAVLLVACAAALLLRGAWRFFAWLVVLVVVGTVAAADTVHALSIALPKRPMEVTAAAAPWAALVIGLLLLDAMARQSRPGRKAGSPSYAAGPDLTAAAQRPGSGGQPARGADTVPLSALLAIARPETPAATPPAPHPPAPHPPAPHPAGPPMTQPAVRPAAHPIPPAVRLITQPTAQQPWQTASAQTAQTPSQQAGQTASQSAAEPSAQPAGEPGTEAATKPQAEKAVTPAGAEPPKPPQPGPDTLAGAEPAKPQQSGTSKAAAAEPEKPPESVAGEPPKAEPRTPADASKPAAAEPEKLPEPVAGEPARTEPEKPADASKPAGAGTLFSWLRRTRAAPAETSGNGTSAPSKEPAAPSATAGTDTT